MRYILSPNASRSLESLKQFSLEHFGERQTKSYLHDLLESMEQIAANPQIGRIRNELLQGCHSWFVGSHTIYYRERQGHIEIIDILHQSAEPSRYILEADEDE